MIRWTVGANGAMINEQAWSAFDARATFTFIGSDQANQKAVICEMDTGAAGVGLPSAVFVVWKTQITSLACDGSGLPDLAWSVDGLDLPFGRRDLLGYNGPDNCYLDAYDAGDDACRL